MVRRPQAHITGDQAHTRVRQLFEDQGYAVNDLTKDYGEDMLVRIFENGAATPYAFFVQSKGSKARRKLQPTIDNGKLSYAVLISSRHIQLWQKFALPVVLTLWNNETGTIHWEFIPIKSYQWPPKALAQPKRIRIPVSQVLDRRGINDIRVKVTEGHKIVERMAQCIDALLDLVVKHTPIRKIQCDPADMTIIYKIPNSTDWQYLILGDLAHIAELGTQAVGYKGTPGRFLKTLLRAEISRIERGVHPVKREFKRTTQEDIDELKRHIARRTSRKNNK